MQATFMMAFLSIAALVGLLWILLTRLLPVLLKLCGRRDGSIPAFEDRLGGILFLLCADVLVSIAFWYPVYVCNQPGASDDRMGFAFVFCVPFWIGGMVITGLAYGRLLRAVSGNHRSVGNVIYAVSGSLMAFVGLSPLIAIAYRMFLSAIRHP